MKKNVVIWFVSIFVLSLILPLKTYAANPVTVQIDGKPIVFKNGQPVVNKDGRTMVPIRDISESLGYNVSWNVSSQTVTIKNNVSTISITIGSKKIMVNGNSKTMDTVAYITKGSTMVPLRFVVEGLGENLTWNQKTLTANILASGESYIPEVPVIPETPPTTKTIILDPGHGGVDSGAVGGDGTHEQLYNYSFALSAKTALEANGYKVILTRSSNSSCVKYTNKYIDLDCRIALSKTHDASLFISIHSNASTSALSKGTEVHYNARNDYDGHQNPFPAESARLAKLIQSRVVDALGTSNRGTINSNLYVNRMATVPSVLVELAFVSNNSDLTILKSTNKKTAFAVALTKAVDSYFEN